MFEKCKTCIGKYDYKSSGKCRYCTENSERHTYFGFRDDIEVKSYYHEVADTSTEDGNIPY